jgi:hypothetical protein
MPFEPGHKKLAGRQKGTPNKVNSVVSDILQAKNMNLVEEAIALYSEGDHEFKLKVLNLLFPYAYSKKVDIPDDSLDVTPEHSAAEAIEFIRENYPQLLKAADE